MTWPQLEAIAQIATGRILNSLPEGLLIALFAWTMLRLLPRQNSGTRFAVWFVALLSVVALPFVGGITGHSLLADREQPLLKLPALWGLGLFSVWILAACLATLRLATGLWHLRELRKSCIPIDTVTLPPAVQRTVAGFSSNRRFFYRRTVQLATSDRISVPAAIGFFKPIIVIPAWALQELPAEELNIILLHEFAHLRRWDDWTNLLQKMVQAVFLFHPAVWWIESRLSLEREMACDDAVLAETGSPRGYARCLIGLLEKTAARRGWAMAQAAVHHAREASLRLARILDGHRPNTRYIWKPALGVVSAFSLLCFWIVPSAPQLIAFEPNGRAIENVHAAFPANATQSKIPAAMVVPASLHASSTSSSPSSSLSTKKVHRQVLTRPLVAHNQRDFSMIAAGWNAEREGTVVNAVNAIATDSVNLTGSITAQPASETLLLVHTAQRVGPNSWVWSVSVWRVTLLTPQQAATEKAPVVKKT